MTEWPYQRVARELAEAIRAGRISTLGSLRTLAVTWHVSYRTMWKAVQELGREGLVDITPCQPTRLRGPATVEEQTTTTDRILSLIRAGITDGTYRAGKPFPKNEFFVHTHNVSHSTVTMAFLRLAQENLVHKSKRAWIAGPQPSRPTGRTTHAQYREPPVVLFQDNLPGSWRTFAESDFTRKLLDPFGEELIPSGHCIMPTARARNLQTQSAPIPIAVPVGLEETAGLIRDLGSRYHGVFVAGSTPVEEELQHWLGSFAQFGRPIVFFDGSGRGVFLTRKALGLGRQYVRLSLNEDAALRSALSALYTAGHRRVGMHGWEVYDWSQTRLARLEEMSGEFPGLSIVRSAPSEPLWNFLNWEGTNEVLVGAMEAVGVPLNDEANQRQLHPAIGEYLRGNTPSLTSMLVDKGITALIAPSDRFAREYFFWGRAVGVRIPRDLSIVSFDNASDSLYFPVSTIDFGLGRLGYLAAHVFLGDVPVRADRSGTIDAIPSLVDRGSIAGPGNPARALGAARR